MGCMHCATRNALHTSVMRSISGVSMDWNLKKRRVCCFELPMALIPVRNRLILRSRVQSRQCRTICEGGVL